MAIVATDSSTSLGEQGQGLENGKGGDVRVQASGDNFEQVMLTYNDAIPQHSDAMRSCQELRAVRGVVDEVVNLATSMGEEIASLQGIKDEVDVLSATMADAEALKDLSEKFEPIQRAQAEAETIHTLRSELDALAPKLDAAVRYLERLRRASILVGVGVGVTTTYGVFLAFGSGLVAFIAFFAFVGAALILTGC